MSFEEWKERLDRDLNIGTERLPLLIEEQKIDTESNLEEELELAKEDWKQARNYFNLVADPELVEYAIYLLEATEKRYDYLLKKKKKSEN